MDWKSVKKAERHIHLEGSMTTERVVQFAATDPAHPWHGLQAEDVRATLNEPGFPTFLENYKLGYSLLRTERDFQLITEDLCRSFEAHAVVRADVLYSPGPAIQKLGCSLKAIHRGIARGLDQFPNLEIRFILDTVINLGPAFMMETLNHVLLDQPGFLEGFSIGGGLPDLDMHTLLPLFERAAEAGLFLTAHCGEVDAPKNIQILIDHAPVKRIAHAIRAVEDQSVLESLRKNQVTIDVCLTSNLRTGVVEQLDKHPVHRFLECGIPITLNTDDPFYFETDLIREYELAESLIGTDAVLMAVQHALTLTDE